MKDKLITPEAADRLIAAHDGDVALLYIYVLSTGIRDMEKAAGALCRTKQEILAASEKLRRMGLLEEKVTPEPQEGMPQYMAADLSRAAKENTDFSAILSEARRVMGKPASSNDMRVLFGLYDYLGLPVDVIFMLLNYAAERCTQLYGAGRVPTAKFIEQEGCRWQQREIYTIALADDYIRAEREKHSRVGEMKKLFAIRHDLTPTERKYLEAWAELGFDDEVLSIAQDRTITRTGSMKWAYMNKILQNWKENGIRTVEDVEARDNPSAQRYGGKPVTEVDTSDLDSLFEKI